MEKDNHTTRQYASGPYCPVVPVHSTRDGRHFITQTQHGERDTRLVSALESPRVYEKGMFSSFNDFVWWQTE